MIADFVLRIHSLLGCNWQNVAGNWGQLIRKENRVLWRLPALRDQRFFEWDTTIKLFLLKIPELSANGIPGSFDDRLRGFSVVISLVSVEICLNEGNYKEEYNRAIGPYLVIRKQEKHSFLGC